MLSFLGRICLCCALGAIGCQPLLQKRKSPLVPPLMSADCVVVEIFFARFPWAEAEVNGPLWDEIDEQALEPALRRRLAESGFRAGIVEGQIPIKLQQLLQLTSEAPSATDTIVENFEEDSPVTRWQRQIRSGKRCEIMASGIHDSLPLLIKENGELRGETYSKGQGLFCLKAYPQGDGRARLDVVPELHHGEHKQVWVGSHDMLRLDPSRAKKAFDQLAIQATLSPGQMLVLTALPDRPRSLGYYFFSHHDSGKPEQKLLLIRLAQTQHDDLFSPELKTAPDE